MTNATNFYNVNTSGWVSNNNASNANGVCFGFCRRGRDPRQHGQTE